MKKSKILRNLTDSHDKFFRVIEGLSDEAIQEPGVIGNWSVKDIMAHISRWEAEMVKMLWQMQEGQRTDYELSFERNIDDLNSQWQKEMASRSLSQTIADFNAVRKQTIRRLEAFSDEDLSDPDRFPDLKGQPLENLIAGNSFEHEAEHAAQIKVWRSQHKIR